MSENQHNLPSHRHYEQPPQQDPPSGFALQAAQPRLQTPVASTLTLLIRDERQHGKRLLTYIRIPLRQEDPNDSGVWADAQEVSEELQRSPSRIDGRAKVYTLRGIHKQYFLQTFEDGTYTCLPANLFMSLRWTLEIFIEDGSSIPRYPAPSSSFSPTPQFPFGGLPLAPANAVGEYIRRVIVDSEPSWKTFAANRSLQLSMRGQLPQYRYIASVVARFAGSTAPGIDLPRAARGVCVSREQIMKAFNLKQEWWETCEEILELVGLYGEGGSRGEDKKVVEMMDEVPPVTVGMQAMKFLKVLREVHAQWTMKMEQTE